MNKSTTTQLAFELPHRPSFGKEDFLIAKCNVEAVRMIDSWPDWAFFALCIYGDEGCGKTHLAHVWSSNVSRLSNYPYRIPMIKAKSIRLENVHQHFEKTNCLIVEDLDEAVNQEALFHLYNLYRNEGGFLLFTSRLAPARINFSLPDLQSRLNAVPSIEIKEPDDELLSSMILKMFMDRQIMLTPELINYILQNMQRSFSYAKKLVGEIDNLSLSQKRAISILLIKEALQNLASPSQGELF